LRAVIIFQYGGDNSSSGTDYFKGNLFGYTVYGMFGLFMIALVIGLIWQYYSRTQKEHKHQNSAGEQRLKICLFQVKSNLSSSWT